MKTLYTVEIEHDKPLSEKVIGVLSRELGSRAYMLIHTSGERCGEVKANLWQRDLAELPVKTGTVHYEPFRRCLGHGAGPTGHQLRQDCVNCGRRTAPRPSGLVEFLAPALEYPCPNRVPSEAE